jgi:hypothetical protein
LGSSGIQRPSAVIPVDPDRLWHVLPGAHGVKMRPHSEYSGSGPLWPLASGQAYWGVRGKNGDRHTKGISQLG